MSHFLLNFASGFGAKLAKFERVNMVLLTLAISARQLLADSQFGNAGSWVQEAPCIHTATAKAMTTVRKKLSDA